MGWHLVMRLLVAFTVLLFGSGIAIGPVDGHAPVLARRIHGQAAVVWTVLLGVHVLAYLRRVPRGAAARRGTFVAATLVTGLVLGIATLPVDHVWRTCRTD